MAKDALRPVIAAITGLIFTGVLAQEPLHQVQAIVDGVRNNRHAWQADSLMRLEPGVVVSRTDFNTRNVMLQISADCSLDRSSVNALLAPLGMSVRCWQRAPLVWGTPFRHLDPRDDCQPATVR